LRDGAPELLLMLGILFLAGLLTDLVGRRTPLPRISLLIVVGFVAGPSALDLLPDLGRTWFPAVANLALVMVGFLLGGGLTAKTLRRHGREVLWVSLAVLVGTVLCVGGGLWLLGVPLETAILLGAVSTATAPAAVADVVRESHAEGPFTRVLLGVVAIDDAWGLILFSALFAGVLAATGESGAAGALWHGARDLGGALALGLLLGVPMAAVTGRLRPGEPTQAEALGAVFLCGGLALWLDVSFLLAAMVLGAVVANLARHHRRPFSALEGIEWPFMILFFVLSGASLQPGSLLDEGLLAVGYVVLRVLGRLVGGWVGARLSGLQGPARQWMGLALLPQAGVALGMALLVAQRLPEIGDVLLPVVIGTTAVFELAGPLFTRRALRATGEEGQAPGAGDPDDDGDDD